MEWVRKFLDFKAQDENKVFLFAFVGIIAMCYNLMKEEILVRLRELKADLIERYDLDWSFQSCYVIRLRIKSLFDGSQDCKMSVDAYEADSVSVSSRAGLNLHEPE